MASCGSRIGGPPIYDVRAVKLFLNCSFSIDVSYCFADLLRVFFFVLCSVCIKILNLVELGILNRTIGVKIVC